MNYEKVTDWFREAAYLLLVLWGGVGSILSQEVVKCLLKVSPFASPAMVHDQDEVDVGF